MQFVSLVGPLERAIHDQGLNPVIDPKAVERGAARPSPRMAGEPAYRRAGLDVIRFPQPA